MNDKILTTDLARRQDEAEQFDSRRSWWRLEQATRLGVSIPEIVRAEVLTQDDLVDAHIAINAALRDVRVARSDAEALACWLQPMDDDWETQRLRRRNPAHFAIEDRMAAAIAELGPQPREPQSLHPLPEEQRGAMAALRARGEWAARHWAIRLQAAHELLALAATGDVFTEAYVNGLLEYAGRRPPSHAAYMAALEGGF